MTEHFLTALPIVSLQTGNKQKWVPLMIDVKSEGPRERSASRNNSRQNENPRLPPNARNDLRGQSAQFTHSWFLRALEISENT